MRRRWGSSPPPGPEVRSARCTCRTRTISFPSTDRAGVAPMERPTVPKALAASKAERYEFGPGSPRPPLEPPDIRRRNTATARSINPPNREPHRTVDGLPGKGAPEGGNPGVSPNPGHQHQDQDAQGNGLDSSCSGRGEPSDDHEEHGEEHRWIVGRSVVHRVEAGGSGGHGHERAVHQRGPTTPRSWSWFPHSKAVNITQKGEGGPR